MYVSIQEAVINYVLFGLLEDKKDVQDLLFQERLIQIMIPNKKIEKTKKMSLFMMEKRY